MTYNFDEIINRENTDAIKLERRKLLFGTDDVLPLWVADMDFRTPDFILNAIKKRLEHPILGYTDKPDEFFDVFIEWALSHGYNNELTLDRIDNDGNYTPDNCRFVSMAEQSMNKSNTVRITHKGETHTAACAYWEDYLSKLPLFL